MTRPPVLLVVALILWPAAVVAASASGWLGSMPPQTPPRLADLTIILVAYALLWSGRRIPAMPLNSHPTEAV